MANIIHAPTKPEAAGLGFFERYLSVWVALCMAAGIVLGVLSIIVNIIISLVLGFGLFAFFQSGGGNSLQQAQQCLSQAQNAGSPAAV